VTILTEKCANRGFNNQLNWMTQPIASYTTCTTVCYLTKNLPFPCNKRCPAPGN